MLLVVHAYSLENFDRKNYHYSHLCYGTSLKALIRLMDKKNFIFIGTNIARNNAFFVNKEEIDKLNFSLPDQNNLKKYTKSFIRESRSANGDLNYLSYKERIKEIANCEVVDVSVSENKKYLFKDLMQKF